MTLIQRHDGTVYDLLDYGIRTRDLIISSPSPIHHFEQVEGENGVIDYGTTYGPRDITAYYRATAYDTIDFSLLRDEIFNLFRTEESFYLIEKREPGKRWLVKVANHFQIPQRNVYGNFEVEFIGLRGVSESVGTTQDIQNRGISANDVLWGFGMGLITDSDSLIYTHINKTSFKIYNAGNVQIHPFEQDLKIEIDFPSSVLFNTTFELKNNTNGSVFKINEVIKPNQKIVLDGPNITSNGLNFLRSTNKDFIILEPGWNDFTVIGNTQATIKFDFPFYYL